ncbi:MAG TPA: CHAT domain-containing protein, partial [Mariniphaga sp.]|nr:CHAT domain-containing protein [Mariniphaga sp.]
YPDTKIYFLSLKAAIHQQLNQFDDALNVYHSAIKNAEEFYANQNLNLIYEYINYSIFLTQNEKLNQAQNVLDQANKIFNQHNINEGKLYALYLKTVGFHLERKLVQTNDYNDFVQEKSSNLYEAINYYKDALKSLGMGADDLQKLSGSVSNSLSLTQSLELLKLIADTYTRITDIYADPEHPKRNEAVRDAFNFYELTTNLLHQARKEIYSDENKIQLGELEEATHLKIIQTAWKANSLNQLPGIAELAFSASEQMKASSLFDRLSEQLARNNSIIPDSITQRERTLNYSITTLNENLYNLRHDETNNETEIAKLDSTLFQLKKQRDELYQYIEDNHADYYEMKYSNSMLTIEEVKQNLKSNEVVIEYVLNEKDSIPELYAFYISSDEYGFYKLNVDSSFIPSLTETFSFLSSPSFLFAGNSNSINYCISANGLYKTLLQPFEDKIRDKKLTIIPDGKLSYLPFEALLTELPDTTGLVQFNKLSYLIKRNTINYSYSVNLLYKFKRHNRTSKKKLLAFAPTYSSDTIHFDNETLILPPLPGVQKEVELVGNELKSNLFIGPDATEENFRNECQNYDILHLAMHAFINDSMPAYSRFAFTQNEESDSDNDGWLNTADIYNLDLNARLTVLSACNTGRGKLRKGEGIMSLARGFLYAGCPSIIMSLWEVEDNAGTEIMHSFYQSVKKGINTDEALRQAKLKYLENANTRLAHPHYWLGYVSIGNSDPLFRSYDYYFFGIIFLLLIALAADQILLRRRSVNRHI